MNNKITYKINLSFNLGSMVNEVGELEKAMNNSLATWGINDKFSIRSKALTLSMHCDREIKTKEKATMIDFIEKTFNERFEGWKFKIESFRRQSCNKPCNQSRSQSS